MMMVSPEIDYRWKRTYFWTLSVQEPIVRKPSSFRRLASLESTKRPPQFQISSSYNQTSHFQLLKSSFSKVHFHIGGPQEAQCTTWTCWLVRRWSLDGRSWSQTIFGFLSDSLHTYMTDSLMAGRTGRTGRTGRIIYDESAPTTRLPLGPSNLILLTWGCPPKNTPRIGMQTSNAIKNYIFLKVNLWLSALVF